MTEMTQTGAGVLPRVLEAAAAAPDAVAVRGPDATLTYGELLARADELAARLRDAGVQAGDLVGLCIDRSAALVVGALAIVRTGAAYVAIDPQYPDERVRWMLDDSGAVAVVTADGAVERLRPRAHPVVAGDIAYVVYTSGSTGRPKGVPVPHSALANLVAWHRDAFDLGPADRCGQIASPGFDAAVWEIWPSLAAGAAIHVVPPVLRGDPIGLRDWLVAEGITVTFLPTAVAEGVLGLAWPAGTALRCLLTGGDALTRRPPAGLPFALVNNYGLSETAVVATSGVVAPGEDGVPAIGRPIAGVVAEVVDEALRPVAPGAEGELVVGGAALGPGYLNRDDLTAERFVDGPAGRRYRTGDRVRQRPDGELEFLGRLDDQLSIRGFRVEPGEVSAALAALPAIEAAVVVGAGRAGADRRLVAYVVAAGDVRPEPAGLDERLAAFLPEHMVPSSYVWLDALPLTQHGKVDREALPPVEEPVRQAPAGRPPATATEAATAGVVAELLEVQTVGMDENFFLLGGHSMLGAQLIARLDDLYGAEISLRYLFDHPTAAAIASEVDRQVAAGVADGVVAG